MMYILIYCIMILKDKNKTRRKEVFLYTPVTNENYLKSLNHIYINMYKKIFIASGSHLRTFGTTLYEPVLVHTNLRIVRSEFVFFLRVYRNYFIHISVYT